MRAFVRIVSTFLLLTISACSPISNHSYRKNALLLDPAERAQVLSRLKERVAEISSVRMLCHAEIKIGDKSDAVRYAIVTQQPGDVRLEALPMQGFYTLALFTLYKNRAVFLDPSAHKAAVSPSGGSLLRRTFRIPLRDEDIAALIAGRVPARFLDQENGELGAIYKSSDGSTLILESRNQSETLTVTANNWLLSAVSTSSVFDDRELSHLTYGEALPDQSIAFPRSLTIQLPRDGVTVALTVQSLKLNTPISADLFTPTVPKDYRIENEQP